MTGVLKMQGVSVRRGTATILDDVSWEAAEQDRWVILGPNGAGKTTLLQLAAAQMHPSAGTASILGETLGRVDVFELRPRVGFTSSALAERIPRNEAVRDVVLTAAYGRTGRWREKYEDLDHNRASDLLTVFSVLHLADRAFGTLSSGEQKRVQVARALMTDPELLLLDEPASGLDLGGREELVAALAEIAGDPRSPMMVLVTHHVEEVPENFTHAMLMRDGKVHTAGPIAEVLTSENLTAAFDVPLDVNVVDGRYSARAKF